MSELEAVTKSLYQIIGSLQEIVKNKGQQKLFDRERPKLKKTPEMTYNEFIKLALQNRKPVQVSSKKSSFRIQEDLRLLSELSNYNQISIKTFEQISKSKKIHRTTETLRNRYHEDLYKVNQKQMKKIVSWIEKQGMEGYLIFEGDELKIQLADPKEDKKRQRLAEFEVKQQKIRKRIKKSSSVPPTSQELSQILGVYSKMVNIPIKNLVQKLDQVSGDLLELDKYIETKDARMLWTAEEDEILKTGSAQIEILKRYKGKKEVETRKNYLGLQ